MNSIKPTLPPDPLFNNTASAGFYGLAKGFVFTAGGLLISKFYKKILETPNKECFTVCTLFAFSSSLVFDHLLDKLQTKIPSLYPADSEDQKIIQTAVLVGQCISIASLFIPSRFFPQELSFQARMSLGSAGVAGLWTLVATYRH